jgi:hypothetical protein
MVSDEFGQMMLQQGQQTATYLLFTIGLIVVSYQIVLEHNEHH